MARPSHLAQREGELGFWRFGHRARGAKVSGAKVAHGPGVDGTTHSRSGKLPAAGARARTPLSPHFRPTSHTRYFPYKYFHTSIFRLSKIPPTFAPLSPHCRPTVTPLSPHFRPTGGHFSLARATGPRQWRRPDSEWCVPPALARSAQAKLVALAPAVLCCPALALAGQLGAR
jgi:hypothetical protein